MHEILERQLKRLGQSIDRLPETLGEWQRLLERISATYQDNDKGRYLLERAISISSSEMQRLYEDLEKRSRDEILIERDKLGAVTNALNDGLCAYSFKKGLLFSNPAAADYFSQKETPEDDEALFHQLQVTSHTEGGSIYQPEAIFSELMEKRSLKGLRGTITRLQRRRLPVRCNFTPLIEHGATYGFVLHFQDISDELIMQTEQRLSASVFESNESIIITDEAGRILKFNHAFADLCGTELQDVIGRNARIFWGKGQLKIHKTMKRALEKQRSWEGEVLLKTRSGELLQQWLSVTAVKDNEGETSHYVGHLTDITELKQLEAAQQAAMEKAIAADQAKTEFLAVISHEIRTPMNTMLGVIDLLEETKLNGAQQKYLELQRNTSAHLAQLIDDILQYISVDRPCDRNKPEIFNCTEVVDSIIDMMRPRASDQGIALCVNYRGEVPERLNGHPRYLRQILINLIGNAIKFTPEGSITVDVNCNNSNVLHCSVTDSGIGISDEERERVFEPFSQVESALNRQYSGLGLGLAISKRLSDEVGGKLWLDSKYRNGCRFELELPCETVSASDLPPDEAEVVDLSALDAPDANRILLAEDNADNRALFSLYLTNAGYELKEVVNGKDAIQAFRKYSPDLVLMDIQMPIINGYDAIAGIRAWEREQNLDPTPIIALTAHAARDSVEQSRTAGSTDHLTKPIDRTTLLMAIHKQLQAKAKTLSLIE